MRRLRKLGIYISCVLTFAAGTWYAYNWRRQTMLQRALPPNVTLSSQVQSASAARIPVPNPIIDGLSHWYRRLLELPEPPLLGNIADGLPCRQETLGEELARQGAQEFNGKLYNPEGYEIVILESSRAWKQNEELAKQHIVIVVCEE